MSMEECDEKHAMGGSAPKKPSMMERRKSMKAPVLMSKKGGKAEKKAMGGMMGSPAMAAPMAAPAMDPRRAAMLKAMTADVERAMAGAAPGPRASRTSDALIFACDRGDHADGAGHRDRAEYPERDGFRGGGAQHGFGGQQRDVGIHRVTSRSVPVTRPR
jgi:hypothetical protein